MISLPVKIPEKIELLNGILSSIQKEISPVITNKMKPAFENLQSLRHKFEDIKKISKDPTKLSELETDIKEYIKIWTCVSESFIFGSEPECINLKFAWKNSYNKDTSATYNPKSENIAMMYNLAVIYNMEAIEIMSSPELDKKVAKDYLRKSIWLFEKAKNSVIDLKPSDCTKDLNPDNLEMCINIMKGQCHIYVYTTLYEKNPDKTLLMSRVNMQGYKYYEAARKIAEKGPISKLSNHKEIMDILKFNELFFMGTAYYYFAKEQMRIAKDKLEGMGDAEASINKAFNCFATIKKNEKIIPSYLKNIYKQISMECAKEKSVIEDENKRYFHEIRPNEPRSIECKECANPLSIENEFFESFEEKKYIERCVPSVVRMLENDYKKTFGKILNKLTSETNKTAKLKKQIMEKYNLPEAVQTISGEEDIWNIVEKCIEKGNSSSFLEKISELENQSKSIQESINELSKALKVEIEEDENLRKKYGNKWTRPSSNELNKDKIIQLDYIQKQLNDGINIDRRLQEEIHADKEQFDLLKLSKKELLSKIPPPDEDSKFLSPYAKMYFLVNSIE